MPKNNPAYGEKLAKTLQQKMDQGGHRQVDLAALLGVNRKIIHDWLKGTRVNPIKYKFVEQLANHFQLKGEERQVFFIDLGYPTTVNNEKDDTQKIYLKHIVILYDGLSSHDKTNAENLKKSLDPQSYVVDIDQKTELLHDTLERADWIITLLSPQTIYSETLLEKISMAYDISQRNYSKLIALSQNPLETLDQDLLALLPERHCFDYTNKDKLNNFLNNIIDKANPSYELEMVSGAIPLDSNFYIERQADELFKAAFLRSDSAILIKGARQVGKTSLLARGTQLARDAGYKVILTDLQRLVSSDFADLESFFIAIGCLMADQLRLDDYPQDVWRARRSPNMNFDIYMRDIVLGSTDKKILWAIDEADKLLSCQFSDDIFALFRSWHNDRALQPDEPCKRLSLALSYSTEPYLFIKDLNQSPFNVGTKLTLDDLNTAQIKDLNDRYGSPLSQNEIAEFEKLTGGQPYLVRSALNEMVMPEPQLNFEQFLTHLEKNENSLNDHLKRIVLMLEKDKDLYDVVKTFLSSNTIENKADFMRLNSAGIIKGSQERPQMRCELYTEYLQKTL